MSIADHVTIGAYVVAGILFSIRALKIADAQRADMSFVISLLCFIAAHTVH